MPVKRSRVEIYIVIILTSEFSRKKKGKKTYLTKNRAQKTNWTLFFSNSNPQHSRFSNIFSTWTQLTWLIRKVHKDNPNFKRKGVRSETELFKAFSLFGKEKNHKTDVYKATSNTQVCLGNYIWKNMKKWKKIKTIEIFK